jgi:hypothetical protein
MQKRKHNLKKVKKSSVSLEKSKKRELETPKGRDFVQQGIALRVLPRHEIFARFGRYTAETHEPFWPVISKMPRLLMIEVEQDELDALLEGHEWESRGSPVGVTRKSKSQKQAKNLAFPPSYAAQGASGVMREAYARTRASFSTLLTQ